MTGPHSFRLAPHHLEKLEALQRERGYASRTESLHACIEEASLEVLPAHQRMQRFDAELARLMSLAERLDRATKRAYETSLRGLTGGTREIGLSHRTPAPDLIDALRRFWRPGSDPASWLDGLSDPVRRDENLFAMHLFLFDFFHPTTVDEVMADVDPSVETPLEVARDLLIRVLHCMVDRVFIAMY